MMTSKSHTHTHTTHMSCGFKLSNSISCKIPFHRTNFKFSGNILPFITVPFSHDTIFYRQINENYNLSVEIVDKNHIYSFLMQRESHQTKFAYFVFMLPFRHTHYYTLNETKPKSKTVWHL